MAGWLHKEKKRLKGAKFKKQGARLVDGSLSDHRSLVDAVKKVDVVICTISGVHFPSHNALLQLKFVEAIKEAGNIKRFLPSEFGMDPSQMDHAVKPGKGTFKDKMIVRKAIEDAKIPFTYVSANCFAGYFVGMDLAGLVIVGHLYHIFYEGCLTNFEIEGEAEEASKHYPDVQNMRMDQYLKCYL
ncbi:hypothetical protein L1049_003608 [Liquidambar formosana]|uniref:NmrA-like domain-containing protein n=1 Tax=Liquidambar formosana TaxID=63359 RepID=A0AAP0R3H5_LIQFO